MYRDMKSIKPYNSIILFPTYLSKCTYWCQSRVSGSVPLTASPGTAQLLAAGKRATLEPYLELC